jgi:hypothetical protein
MKYISPTIHSKFENYNSRFYSKETRFELQRAFKTAGN